MDQETLFIRLRLLGDIIFTIPALMIYKRFFPDRRILYVVEERFREIADLLPAVAERVVVPDKMGIGAIWRFGAMVRRRGIEQVIDFHSGPKSASLTLATRARERVGYRTPNRNLAYNQLVPRHLPGAPRHSVANQVRLLEAVGIPADVDIPAYPPLGIDRQGIGRQVQDFCNLSGISVVVHTGAGNRFRDWGGDNFSILVRRLQDRGIRVALIGGSREEKGRNAVLSRIAGAYDFSGRLAIRELIWLIAHASAYIGADSGPLHVASLTATPLVALYGPNLPEISGPWRRDNVTILQRSLSCRPCSQRRCVYDRMKCLDDISMDEVYEAVSRFVSGM